MHSVTPAILTTTPDDLKRRLLLIKDHAQTIHIDITDGIYTPVKLLPLEDVIRTLAEINFTNAIELHMMCQYPEKYINEIMRVKNIKKIVLHADATEDIGDVIDLYKQKELEVGLCTNVEDRVKAKGLHMDYFLVLAIVQAGYSGSSFDMDALAQIDQLVKEYKGYIIEVDGGINDITGRICLEHGVTVLISNSYLFKSDNPIDRLATLEHITINHE